MPMKMVQSVLKCRHVKFRCWGITQKKAYNKIGVCCDRHTKRVSTLRGHNSQFRVNLTRQAVMVRNLCKTKIKLHKHWDIKQHLDMFHAFHT